MGGSSKGGKVTVGYRYYFDIHMGLGMPIDELVEIRASKKRIWRGSVTDNQQIHLNAPKVFGGDSGEGGIDGTLDVMFGEENQSVLPKLAEMLGGVVPAFKGITTAFYSGLVTSMNPYPKAWEILRRGGNRLWDGEGAWYPEKQFIWLADGEIKAMNPVHILYLVRTGSRFRGWPRAWMDDTAWRAAADRCYNEGLGLCLEWKRSDSFKSFSDTICAHISAEIFDDRRTGLVSIRLLRDDYDVNQLPLFDEDSGLLEVLEDENTAADEIPSELIVRYVDAINGESKTVRAVNAAVAARYRGRSTETVEYPGCPTGEIAGRLAERDLRIKTSGLKRFKVVLDRRARDINIGEPFRIRSLRRGIEQVVVRAGKIEDGTLLDGRITITALQDVFGLPSSSYVAVPPSGWVPPDRTPAPITHRRLLEVPYMDLAARLDPPNLALVDPSAAWLASVAVAPNDQSRSYTLTTRVGGSGEFIDSKTGDWCPSGLLTLAIDKQATSILIGSPSWLDIVEVGSVALINDEVVRIDALNPATGTCTIARACADTVPQQHAAGSRIWFYSDNAVSDDVAYSMNTTMAAKLLTNTSEGQLDPSLAAVDSLQLQGRQGRPYPPGQFQIGGQFYPASITGDVAVSWAHRDRLGQADQAIDTLFGSTGPEPGTTYVVQLRRADNQTLLTSESGITGTSTVLATEYVGLVVVELWSVRDGLESMQKHQHQFERVDV